MTAPAGASGTGQDNNLVALSLMSGAMMIVPIMDVIAKYLSLSLPPLEVTFGRFVFQLLISLAVAGLTWNLKGLRSKRPMVNYLRGILLSAAVAVFLHGGEVHAGGDGDLDLLRRTDGPDGAGGADPEGKGRDAGGLRRHPGRPRRRA
jgi:hypothetical protein